MRYGCLYVKCCALCSKYMACGCGGSGAAVPRALHCSTCGMAVWLRLCHVLCTVLHGCVRLDLTPCVTCATLWYMRYGRFLCRCAVCCGACAGAVLAPLCQVLYAAAYAGAAGLRHCVMCSALYYMQCVSPGAPVSSAVHCSACVGGCFLCPCVLGPTLWCMRCEGLGVSCQSGPRCTTQATVTHRKGWAAAVRHWALTCCWLACVYTVCMT
jgi:hypothetical protein